MTASHEYIQIMFSLSITSAAVNTHRMMHYVNFKLLLLRET